MKHNVFMDKYLEHINAAAKCYREAMRLEGEEGREVESVRWLIDGDKERRQARKFLRLAEEFDILHKVKDDS